MNCAVLTSTTDRLMSHFSNVLYINVFYMKCTVSTLTTEVAILTEGYWVNIEFLSPSLSLFFSFTVSLSLSLSFSLSLSLFLSFLSFFFFIVFGK